MTDAERISLADHVDRRIADLRAENAQRAEDLQVQIDRRFQAVESHLELSRRTSAEAHRALGEAVGKVAAAVEAMEKAEARDAGADSIKRAAWRSTGATIAAVAALSAVIFSVVDHLT